jgi:hypothetical protein
MSARVCRPRGPRPPGPAEARLHGGDAPEEAPCWGGDRQAAPAIRSSDPAGQAGERVDDGCSRNPRGSPSSSGSPGHATRLPLNPRVTPAAGSGCRCGGIRVKPSRPPPEDAGCGPRDPLGSAEAGDGPWPGARSRWSMPKPLTRTAARATGWRLASHGAIGRCRDSNRAGWNSGDRETGKPGLVGSDV